MPFNEALYQELKPGQPMVVSKEEFKKRFSPLTPSELAALALEKRKAPKEAKEEGKISYQEARDILGSDCLGPEAVEKLLGQRPEYIPPIPFSREDLERAKEVGQFLILRVDKAPDGTPLTLQAMHQLWSAKFEAAGKGKILYEIKDQWKLDSDFFTQETPHVSWALVSKELVPNSTSKNYIVQTEVLIDYLTTKVFEGQQAPPEYQVAIAEFEAKKPNITQLMASNWQEAARMLEALQITRLTRQTPTEARYDSLVYLENNDKRLLENSYTWTSRRSSDGNLVDFGNADAEGADVNRWKPGSTHDGLGVVLSRSL